MFQTDESGNLVQVGFGQPKDPEISQNSELPQRGWGKSFVQPQSSAFGSFHHNPNPFLFPGSMLTRPKAAPFGRGGGSSTGRGFTPAGPSLPPQEALFSSIKMKDKVSQRPPNIQTNTNYSHLNYINITCNFLNSKDNSLCFSAPCPTVSRLLAPELPRSLLSTARPEACWMSWTAERRLSQIR